VSDNASPLQVDRDGPISRLTLDRPHVLNALDRSLVEALIGAFEAIAADADIRVAADDTTFGLPDTSLGLPPTSGLSVLLPRLVGEGRAREFLLIGEQFDVDAALATGFVNQVVPRDALDADTTRLARTISAHPPDGVHRIRSLLRGPGDAEFERALIEETANEVAAFATPEVRARLRAFADRARRSP